MVSLPTSYHPCPNSTLHKYLLCLYVCLFYDPPMIKQGHVRDWDQSSHHNLKGSAETKSYFLTFIGFTFLITFPSWKGNTFTYSVSLGGGFKPPSYIFFYWRLLRHIIKGVASNCLFPTGTGTSGPYHTSKGLSCAPLQWNSVNHLPARGPPPPCAAGPHEDDSYGYTDLFTITFTSQTGVQANHSSTCPQA